jgi:hypothetical protein
VATSVAEELGFIALADLAAASPGEEARVIGGHMVSLHTLRWKLDLPRETLDADLGVTPEIVQTPDLIDRLLRLGYERLGGNRFGRRIEGLPAIEGETPQAIVDVLVPSHTSRPRHNRTFGDHLTTTEVPGLAGARLVKRSRSGLEPVGPHIFIQELDVDVGKADVQSHASIVPVAGVGHQPFHAGPREKERASAARVS